MRLTSPVLLVEDDPDHTLLMRRALERARVANPLVTVSDGEEARDYLFGIGKYDGRDPRDAPVLVLLDLKLPKVDGIDVLREIKGNEATRAIPVVVITSSEEEKDRVESYQLGVNSYVVKPIEFESLVRTITDLGFYWLAINRSVK